MENYEIEKIQLAIQNCLGNGDRCVNCPYHKKQMCKFNLMLDIQQILNEVKKQNRKED